MSETLMFDTTKAQVPHIEYDPESKEYRTKPQTAPYRVTGEDIAAILDRPGYYGEEQTRERLYAELGIRDGGAGTRRKGIDPDPEPEDTQATTVIEVGAEEKYEQAIPVRQVQTPRPRRHKSGRVPNQRRRRS